MSVSLSAEFRVTASRMAARSSCGLAIGSASWRSWAEEHQLHVAWIVDGADCQIVSVVGQVTVSMISSRH